MNVIRSSIAMKLEPSDESTLETECLFGETVEVLDEYLDWVYCMLTTDGYHGWVRKEGLGKSTKPTHRVITSRSFIYTDKNVKSSSLLYLPLGAKLQIENIKSEWAEVILHGYETQVGFIPANHIVCLADRVKDWVKTAEELVGTPYKWGGRDTIGIDCSALLPLAYQTYCEILPRNTSDQVNLEKPNVTIINKLKRGCVIFWKGHVGIMVDRLNCIHANAYHMKTIIEPLFDIIKRTNKDNQIIKMMDFK